MTTEEIVALALKEDLGDGDHTSLATISAESRGKARLIIKDNGILCGLPVAETVFRQVDPDLLPEYFCKDGDRVEKGMIAMTVEGRIRSILAAERTVLNFMQRLSGIATYTNRLMQEVRGTKARLLDTRKTTPGLRMLEKYAVRAGGGTNHRIGLSDGVLIKDNHIVAAGGILPAVAAMRRHIPHTLKIEVETADFAQIDQALQAGADIIMLDNMGINDMKKAVEMIGGKALTEASGNMGDKDLRAVAETGVDIISIGAMTHTVRAMDISLRFNK